MARRRNVKRIDPRYFLNETVNRNDDGSALEEKRIGSMLDPKTYEHPDPEDPNWPWKPGDSVEGNRPHPGEAEPVLGSPKRQPGETRGQYEKRLRQGKHRAQYRLPDPGELDPHELAEEEIEEGCPLEEPGEGGAAIDISAPGTEVHVDDISQLSPEEAFAAGMAAAKDAIDQVIGGGGPPPIEELEE
jgi:hypothetical protein